MFDDLKDDTLESELCTQAAEVSAGECRLVLLIGEFDRRGAWGSAGLRSCAHWLNWRVGTSLGAAREQVRVGRALGRLSRVRAGFAAGELSYSKVRAISRVASPELEESLLELAKHSTASQLEQIVRQYRRADPEEAALAISRHERRYVRSYTDDDGMVVISCRLSPDDGAVVLAAIGAAKVALSDRAAADVPAETSADPAGAAETFPPAPDAFPESHDVWSRPAARAELAQREPLRPVETAAADALVALCASVLDRGLGEEMSDPHVSVLVHVDEQVLSDPRAEGCAHIDGVGAVAGHLARRLACDGAVSTLVFAQDGTVEPRGATRVVPRAMRRALHTRDGGCRFPGCTARRFLQAHHVVFWSKGGPTALSNLVTLCGAHHRLVHEGGFELQLQPNGALRVFANDGTELEAVPRTAPAGGEGLAATHRRQGLHLEDTSLSYGGERFDLGLTIDGLLSVVGRSEYVGAGDRP
jgi:hypothetical protein